MSLLRLALFVIPTIMFLGFLSGTMSGSTADNAWYQILLKPDIQPPGWVFGVVWPTLYLMLGLAFAMVLNARASGLAALTLCHAKNLMRSKPLRPMPAPKPMRLVSALPPWKRPCRQKAAQQPPRRSQRPSRQKVHIELFHSWPTALCCALTLAPCVRVRQGADSNQHDRRNQHARRRRTI